MPKIERKTQKIFAGSGASDDIAAFGSFVSGTPVYTDDIEALQTTAYTQGWSSAIAANEAPFLEEMNGVQYGFSKQLAYLLQNGVPEYDENTTYYANTSFCQIDGVIYQSLTDDNTGNNPATDTTNWKVYYNPSDVPLLSGNNTFTGDNTLSGANNFTGVLEYNGVEVLTQAEAANTSLSNLSSSLNAGSATSPMYISEGTLTASSYSIANDRFDGQWVASTKELSTATAVGTYTIDLSDYLPNDNYNYEIFICGYCEGAASGIAFLNLSSSLLTGARVFCACNQDAHRQGDYTIFPIGIDRNLTISITNQQFGSVAITAIGYRRIGSNS